MLPKVNIPQTNPRASYLAHKKEIDSTIERVLASGWYILGHEVRHFEEAFANYLCTDYAIGVANGTDALEIALRACDIGPGDFVITVSNTAVATASAICRTGAVPVFIDIDPNTYTMAPSALEHVLKKLIHKKLKAVIPVHLYGHPADIDTITDLAKRYGLFVIEDCAQSHGAKWKGNFAGTFGDLSAFSFYPTKNLGAIGDGGMIVTKNVHLAEKVRSLRQYGWQSRNRSTIPGCNSRLDEIQAAVLSVKLRFLENDNHRRQKIAKRYNEKLKDYNIILPSVSIAATHVYHQYVIRYDDRDNIQQRLKQSGIQTIVHYPVPIHKQPAYINNAIVPLSLDITDEIVYEILSLPMFPQMTDQEVDIIADHIASFCKNH